jgi:penicillin-binding protein 2
MFERRLKIFLMFLLVFVVCLLVRSVQLQIVQGSYWRDEAARSMRSETYTDTSRGQIVDCKGAVLARDEPCIDAAVEYAAIIDPPEKVWLRSFSEKRLKDRLGEQYKSSSSSKRREMLKEEMESVTQLIHSMWGRLANLAGVKPEEIELRRQTIQNRVAMRRRYIQWNRYKDALKEHNEQEEPSWYRKWLMGEKTDVPEIDDMGDEPLAEEQQPHTILSAVDTRVQNDLLKHIDDFPGVSLVPSTHRVYPFGNAACHVIGHLRKVSAEDVASDPNIGNQQKSYRPTDLIGRDGLEALGEPTLRGVRGKTVFDGLTNQKISEAPAIPGSDLRTTIDIDLQMQIQEMFTRVKIPWGNRERHGEDVLPMHGSAVIIEVATGDVKALVSYPDYNLNDFDESYSTMVKDKMNSPLLNRATQAMLEPGSTIKPVVGAGAITQGVLGVNEGIECSGFLVINGKRYSTGKCWTVNLARGVLGMNSGMEGHHVIPTEDPHRGHDGNPDGFLTYSDALQRSCNVFFETTANRLGFEGLSYWMEQFGLGRPTGIGIAEVRGRLPRTYDGPNRNFAMWTAGIGQGPVAATPLQMCNVFATFARRGVWVRPNLVYSGQKLDPYRPAKLSPDDTAWSEIPSRVDLHIAPAAINAAFDGMYRVINTKAGTGNICERTDIRMMGKTGTVQAPRLGRVVEDANGQKTMEWFRPSTHDNPNPDMPWYRASDDEGKKLNHAWFDVIVPADNPKYVVSAVVEYGGGGGGTVAGPIAKEIIEALIEHGYLHPNVVRALTN